MAENGAENGDKGTDPQSALSKEEADAVIESWALLWKDKKQNGIDLFVKLFTLYPESLEAFHDFKGLPIQEVAVHKKLRGHALSVMYSIKSFIDTLDDLETLDELVRKNARNHAPRGVGEKQFMWLVPVMMELLDDTMKENATEFHKTAWKKLLGVVASITKDEQESNG